MKFRKVLWTLTALGIFLSSSAFSEENADHSKSAKPFLGRWDLTLKAADGEHASWLEVTLDGDQVKAQMVGRWGNARPLPKVESANGKLTFVSPKEEEAAKADMVFEGKLVGKGLSGTVNGPDGTTWSWTGLRAPSLKRIGTPKWGKPVQLFNGKDLTGWKTSKSDSTAEWKVENGVLVSPGHGPELINNSQFEDFKLHVEFNIGQGANSGIYLRGRYELQIEDDPTPEPPSQRTGGIYGFIAPSLEMPRKPGEWQSFDITLVGRTVTVAQNGKTIIDAQEIPGITGGALDSHEERPGPIYLQGGEDGHVSYRNIVLTPAAK
jgi:hypothetical protein